MSKKILIGKIISAFGIKGEVKLISYCGDPLKIFEYEAFDQNNNSVKFEKRKKQTINFNKQKDAILIVKIEGINNRNQAEEIRGKEIFTNRNNFEETKENEFYEIDLIGLKVVDEEMKEVGEVINIHNFGAGVVMEINFVQKIKNLNKEIIEMIPFKNHFFPEVNIKEKFIKIELLKIIEQLQ
jgi:16S rRNA processing protein RimM